MTQCNVSITLRTAGPKWLSVRGLPFEFRADCFRGLPGRRRGVTALQPYPAYRDSGVEWLGKVPEHWDVRRLGNVGRFFKGSGGSKADETEGGVPCVRYGDLYTRHAFSITESKACVAHHRADAYTRIRYGDVLFAGSGETLEEIGKSAVNLISGSAVCGGDVIVFRPTIDLDAKFIGWSTDCRQAVSQKACMGRGITVMHIYSSELKRLLVPLPPLPEQTAIARFLDHADRRIRRYIRAKEGLIELLEEQKQAIILQAVTGQIDVRTGQPYPAYKDSGVEWLGEVPEDWGVRRLRSLATIGTGGRDTINRKADGLYPFFVRSQTVERIDTWSFDGEAVLTAGDGVGVGKVFHYVNGKFDYHQRVYKFSDFSHTLGQFFFHYFRSTLRNEVFQGTAKSTVDSLRLPMLQNFPVALPPLSEQAPIVEYLDKGAAGIDAAITRAQRQIDLLREYRTRLIADVVTGKLDVRAAAASLPEVNLLAVAEASDETAELSPKLHQLEDDSATKPPHP